MFQGQLPGCPGLESSPRKAAISAGSTSIQWVTKLLPSGAWRRLRVRVRAGGSAASAGGGWSVGVAAKAKAEGCGRFGCRRERHHSAGVSPDAGPTCG